MQYFTFETCAYANDYCYFGKCACFVDIVSRPLSSSGGSSNIGSGDVQCALYEKKKNEKSYILLLTGPFKTSGNLTIIQAHKYWAHVKWSSLCWQ